MKITREAYFITGASGFLATMLAMGYFGTGFVVGWKVYNIFNWKWYCGETN